MEVQFTPVAIALGDGAYPPVLTISYDDGAGAAVIEMYAGGRNSINARVTPAQLRAIIQQASDLADLLDLADALDAPAPDATVSMRVPGGAS